MTEGKAQRFDMLFLERVGVALSANGVRQLVTDDTTVDVRKLE